MHQSLQFLFHVVRRIGRGLAGAPIVSGHAVRLIAGCCLAMGAGIVHGAVTVTCNGDSITHGIGASSVATTAYAAVLGDLLGADYVVKKQATSGATLLKRGDLSFWSDTKGVQNTVAGAPNIITIMLGTNDSKGINWKYGYEYADDYHAIIDVYETISTAPDIHLALPLPSTEGSIRGSVIADQIIPKILAVARRRNLKVIDTHTPFLDGVATLLGDGVHPNDAGHLLIAQTIHAALIDGQVLTAVPSPWQRQDIGAVTVTGGDAVGPGESGDVFHLLGAGTDIGDNADAFRFVYQTTSGDCGVSARVLGQRNVDPNVATQPGAPGGVMIRESLAADAPHAAVLVTPGNGVSFRWRSAAGAGTSVSLVPDGASPRWVRIVRAGDVFTGHYSTDGVVWTVVGTPQAIALSSAATAGLVGGSGLAGKLCTTRLDQVNVNRQPAALPAAPGQLTAVADAGRVDLTWNAVAGATTYKVLRATAATGPFAQIATVSATGFSDAEVIHGTSYFYGVSAIGEAGEGVVSDLAAAEPPETPTGLVATTAGPTSVALTWSKRDGATGFKLKRATVAGGPYADLATVTDGTAFTDTGLVSGAAYYYVVSAINGSGESADSQESAPVPYVITGVYGTFDPDVSATRSIISGAFASLFDAARPERAYLAGTASKRPLLATFPGTGKGSLSFNGARAMTGPMSNDILTPAVDEDFTIVAAIHIPAHALTLNGIIININKVDTQVGVGIGFNYAQNKFYASYVNPSTGGVVSVTAATAIVPGSSHVLRLRKEGASVQLFVDGVKEAETSGARGPILAAAEGGPVAIGGLRSLNPQFTGFLGKFFLCKGVPTAEEAADMESDLNVWMGLAPALTPLQAWRVENGLPWDGSGIAADDHDPLGAGVPNLLRYALGMTTTTTDTGKLPVVRMNEGRLAICFSRDTTRTDIDYIVEASSDLTESSWLPIASSVSGGPMTNLGIAWSVEETGDQIKAVVVESPGPDLGETRQFLRLMVSR